MMNSLKFPIVYAVTFLAVLGLVSVVNWTSDPANVFGQGKTEKRIAEILTRGSYASGVTNYNERLLQLYTINLRSGPPDVIILGSSRSMPVHAGNFPGKSLFNHSVPGASLEDFVAIYQMYAERNMTPGHVVIGFDPWLLNSNNGQFRWQYIKSFFYKAARRLGVTPRGPRYQTVVESKEYETLISMDYFLQSVKSLFDGTQGSKIMERKDDRTKLAVKRPDGSIKPAGSQLKKFPKDVAAEAISTAHGPSAYSLGNFGRFDETAVALFQRFVEHLVEKDVKVTMLLLPYHPEAYPILINRPSYRIISSVETYLHRLTKRAGIEIRGSYDPVKTGCIASEYLDFQHFTSACIDRIIQ